MTTAVKGPGSCLVKRPSEVCDECKLERQNNVTHCRTHQFICKEQSYPSVPTLVRRSHWGGQVRKMSKIYSLPSSYGQEKQPTALRQGERSSCTGKIQRREKTEATQARRLRTEKRSLNFNLEMTDCAHGESRLPWK